MGRIAAPPGHSEGEAGGPGWPLHQVPVDSLKALGALDIPRGEFWTRDRGLWEVRAGWHEGNLIILSEASDARARETFTLSDGGRRLDVEVRIDARGDDLAVSRTFRRAD